MFRVPVLMVPAIGLLNLTVTFGSSLRMRAVSTYEFPPVRKFMNVKCEMILKSKSIVPALKRETFYISQL